MLNIKRAIIRPYGLQIDTIINKDITIDDLCNEKYAVVKSKNGIMVYGVFSLDVLIDEISRFRCDYIPTIGVSIESAFKDAFCASERVFYFNTIDTVCFMATILKEVGLSPIIIDTSIIFTGLSDVDILAYVISALSNLPADRLMSIIHAYSEPINDTIVESLLSYIEENAFFHEDTLHIVDTDDITISTTLNVLLASIGNPILYDNTGYRISNMDDDILNKVKDRIKRLYVFNKIIEKEDDE